MCFLRHHFIHFHPTSPQPPTNTYKTTPYTHNTFSSIIIILTYLILKYGVKHNLKMLININGKFTCLKKENPTITFFDHWVKCG